MHKFPGSHITMVLLLASTFCVAQTVTTDPAIPRADQPVTITVDVTGTTLDNFAWNNTTNPVWLWAWVSEGCASNCDAPTNINPATSAQDAAKVTRISTNPDKYQITITPTAFFNRPVSELKKIGIKLKTRAWTDNKQTDNDRFIELFTGFVVNFSEPATFPLFKSSGDEIDITANASASSDLTLKINGATVHSASDATIVTYTHTVAESPGEVDVTIEANNGSETKTASFKYIVRTPVVNESRPDGIIDGINYSTDASKATLSLWAPGKSSVYLIGDFTDWKIDPAYQMKKDDEHFWLEVTGLTAGQEYAFQYLVDESVYLADPYADKILDPDDQFIPAGTYPGLKPFPAAARKDQWYNNRLSVLQTSQTPYVWQVTAFVKPPKEKLVVYELLVRDFFAENERNYQNLIDTIGYFKKLGINAIELMPVMEFNGNESWGYNPAFMFAPDKYYGTKNKLKEFIDKCHQNGIAVILDIVMNHQDLPNPYVMMDYDFATNKPQADNKWFNTDARHPFNVFFDMNHESAYTKKYLDTVNHYWLNEFKADGFRFDLSKGFTQANNPTDVGAWSAYDPSRIAILKRMADEIWSHTPDAYVILEHLSVNSEEKELAEYRANEGKGMMLWGKMTDPYNENTMGYEGNSDISGVYHASRSWTVPHLIGYMESHDEERLMYKNFQNGRNGSGHNTKTVPIALKRMAAAATIFYTVPGPKMLWQFGELGYDFSINHCPDGTNSTDCRISPKPVKWEYRDDESRYALYEHISDLNRLRKEFDVFTEGAATLPSGNDAVKQLILKNDPYTATPSQASDMNAVVVVNFAIVSKEVSPNFPHTGIWYDYYEGGHQLDIASDFKFTLKPGEYKLFTDFAIESPFVTGVEEATQEEVSVYPNPVEDILTVRKEGASALDLVLFTSQGSRVVLPRVDEHSWDASRLITGLYIAEVKTGRRIYRMKIVKR
jgi:1,4-alpha-glucan branching enzyme